MRILAIYNMKGGVGKTATAVNIAHQAAANGQRTLLCDLDPQGASSYYFRIRPPKKHGARRLLKGGSKTHRAIRETDYLNLDLLPSTLSYRQLDILLDGAKNGRSWLGRLLHEFTGDYDLVVLDCAPNLTLSSENVFAAADVVLMPMIPTTLSVLTFRKVHKFFAENGLDESKLFVFFSMVERRKLMHRQTISSIAQEARRVLPTEIPYSADVERMGVHREPVEVSRPRSAAAAAYRSLWSEVRAVLNGREARVSN